MAERDCWFAGEKMATPIYDGGKLLAGNRIAGPAVIEEPTTTVVIPATYTATVDNERSYHLTRNDAGSGQAGGAQ